MNLQEEMQKQIIKTAFKRLQEQNRIKVISDDEKNKEVIVVFDYENDESRVFGKVVIRGKMYCDFKGVFYENEQKEKTC